MHESACPSNLPIFFLSLAVRPHHRSFLLVAIVGSLSPSPFSRIYCFRDFSVAFHSLPYAHQQAVAHSALIFSDLWLLAFIQHRRSPKAKTRINWQRRAEVFCEPQSRSSPRV
jgi:hypothetical protein